MDKPISVQIEEAKKKLEDVLNETHLHPYILEPIVKELYTTVVQVKNQYYQQELAAFKQAENEDKQTKE